MAQPASIKNTDAQSMDTIFGGDGVGRAKIAIGGKAATGLTPEVAWQGVATHQEGDTFAASEGVVVAGGTDGSDVVRPSLVDDSGRNIVVTVPTQGTLTDRSGSITSGTTAQQLAASNTSRKYLFVQNVDASEALWINFGVDAVLDQPSIKLVAGETFLMEGSFVSTQAVSVNATTTGHKFTAKEG